METRRDGDVCLAGENESKNESKREMKVIGLLLFVLYFHCSLSLSLSLAIVSPSFRTLFGLIFRLIITGRVSQSFKLSLVCLSSYCVCVQLNRQLNRQMKWTLAIGH